MFTWDNKPIMALFQRMFRSSKNSKGDGNNRRNDTVPKTVPPKLDKSEIRLVIHADCDRGRIPYFDSKAIQQIDEPDKQNAAKTVHKSMRARAFNMGQRESQGLHQKPSPKYHFQRLGQDVKMLEEMMFGTTPMTFKGSSLKVHMLKSPHQLMVSKVFVPEKPRRESLGGDTESDSNSLPCSSADFSSEEYIAPIRKAAPKYAQSIPVDVPSKELFQDNSTDDDSGVAASFTSSGSLRTSFPSPSNNSLSSYNSLHRRWMRAQTTTLDRKNMQESNLVTERTLSRSRRNKLAIGILFGSLDEKDEDSINLFQSFFFSHFALLEGHVEKLRSVIEKAYFNQRSFLPATMEALAEFRNSIHDLYMAPRLSEPIWLTMMSTTTYRMVLAEKFMADFNWLVTKFDNKNCRFFVSTLLSAVLTQHLAWVATVTPSGGTPTRTYRDKHSAKWVDALAKTHPYNPLWAQLGDLFGAIGLPLKISRTVVVGKKADVVKKFLSMLSYFIRCSDLHENSDLQGLCNLVNDTNFDLSFSPTSSENTLVEAASQEGNISPMSSSFFCRQTSMSSGGSVGRVSQVVRQVDSCHRSGNKLEERSSNYSPKSQIQDMCQDDAKSSKPSRVLSKCERSDSGYNGAELECDSGLAHPSNNDTDSWKCAGQCVQTFHTEKCQSSSVGKEALNIESLAGGDKCCASSNCSVKGHKAFCDMCNHSKSSIVSAQGNGQFELSSFRGSEQRIALSDLHIYSPESPIAINLVAAKVCESPKTESVIHVNKSAVDLKQDLVAGFQNTPPVVRSQSFSEGKIKSRLSQQLESNAKTELADMASKSKMQEVRKRFLAEGSNSLFEDLYEPGVETKTIDDIKDEDRVIGSSLGSSLSKLSLEAGKEADVSRRSSFNRQISQETKSHSSRPTSLGRCRSITPTELSRRRHLSSTGSIDYEVFDPLLHCKEIKLPSVPSETSQWNIKAFDRNFGRSLLAGYTDHYMSDFVLHGTSDINFKGRLLNDLQMTMQHSILDEPVDEAVCVIADTDNWTVEVASSKVMSISPSGCTTWTSSKMVADLIESVVELFRMKMSAEFCVMHLEDRLQEIYFKSLMLSEYLSMTSTVSQGELTSMLGFESSDMPLLLAIAGTHTPSLALGAQ